MATNETTDSQDQNHRELRWLGGSEESLRAWMAEWGLDLNKYGVENAKTVAKLREEVLAGETTLTIENHVPVRAVRVVSLLLKNAADQTLIEESQVFPDGRVRRRGLPLSEKMIGEEDWHSTAVRGVREELGTVLSSNAKIFIKENTHYVELEEMYSMSYPGLLTRYTLHRVQGVIPELPQVGSFTTSEETAQGVLTNNWTWTERVEAKKGAVKQGS